MKNIAYLTNASVQSGVGSRAYYMKQALLKAAPTQGVSVVEFLLNGARGHLQKDGRPVGGIQPWPGALGAKTINWLRLGRKLHTYWGKTDRLEYALVHATNQSLSFLLPQTLPGIVTVHDIIELTDPQSKAGKFAAGYLYRGIPRAAHIVAVSKYTAHQVTDAYGITAASITVIPNAVSPLLHEIPHFTQTVGYHNLLRELKIPAGSKIILMVGSDHPRKNLAVAMAAFAAVRKSIPQTWLVKVGEPGLAAGRAELLAAIDRHNVRHAVRLLGAVAPEQLNELYNAADVLLHTARLEGFGLPPLEAMAVGTPVVTSNAASLPEVVGDAALLHDPDDIDSFAQSVTRVLSDTELAGQLRDKGLQQAQRFRWDESAEQLLGVYRKFI